MPQGVHSIGARAAPAGLLDELVAAIQRMPLAALAIFIAGRALLWTIVPTLVFKDLPLDVIEGVAYGRDWQLGYWKHPPLPWIIVDITHRIFGGHIWGFFLLGQLCAVAASWAVWRLGCEMFTQVEAFAAVVVLDGYIDFNMNPGVFNHNVLQLPLFALAGWSLYRAFARGALRDWLLTALWFAAAFYTKYEVIVLLAPALLFSMVDPRARRCWKTAGPYLAAILCAVLIAPQAFWLAFVAHFSPIRFAGEKAPVSNSLLALLWANGSFTANALLYAVPIALLFAVMAGGIYRPKPASAAPSDNFARRYLAFLTFGPLITAVVLGFASGRQLENGWAEQFWCFASLYMIALWRPAVDAPALRRLAMGWSGLTALYLAITVAAGVFLVAPGYFYETQFPGEQFADQVTQGWHREMGAAPLPYIVSAFWPAGNVILYSRERPRMLEEGDPTHSPRVDLADLRRRGAVILLLPRAALNFTAPSGATAAWLTEFPEAEPEPPIIVRRKTARGELSWTTDWALLRPEKGGG